MRAEVLQSVGDYWLADILPAPGKEFEEDSRKAYLMFRDFAFDDGTPSKDRWPMPGDLVVMTPLRVLENPVLEMRCVRCGERIVNSAGIPAEEVGELPGDDGGLTHVSCMTEEEIQSF